MIHFLDSFIAVRHISASVLSVNILCFELSSIMINRTFTDHCAYRSLHLSPSNLSNQTVLGSVTLVKSNAKALLTGKPIKIADLQAGFALFEE